MTIRILIADDHPMVREGSKAALAPLLDMEIVAEAATGQAAIREAILQQPDVVIMGLQMAALSGIDATRELARAVPTAAVLVLTMFDDDSVAAMRAGGTVPGPGRPGRAGVAGRPPGQAGPGWRRSSHAWPW